MPIKFACECGRNLIVPDERAGRSVQCPKCGRRVAVPGERRADLPLDPPPAEGKSVNRPALDKPVESKPQPKQPTLEKPAGEKPATEKLVASSKPSGPSRERAPGSTRLPEKSPPRSAAAKSPSARSSPPPLKPRETKMPPAAAPSASTAQPEPPLPTPPAIAASVVEVAATAPPPAPPAPPVPPAPIATPSAQRYGYQPDQEKLGAAYVLAMLVALLGIFSMAPAVYDVARYLSNTDGDFVGRWAFLLFFLGMVHLAYAIYLTQLPDWSSAWVLTGMTLGQGALYAMLLTTAYLARGHSQLVQALDLSAYIDNGKAIGWCFIMLCLTGVVAYFCGRVSIRWRRSFVTLRDAHRHA